MAVTKKTLAELVMTVKRGLSSYYLEPLSGGVEVPYINIKDIDGLRIIRDRIDMVRVKEGRALERNRIDTNDIILSVKGSTFKAAIADASVKDCVISANLIALRVRHEVLPEIIVAYLNSPEGQRKLSAISVGATQTAINMSALMKLEIPIPERAAQMAMAEYYILANQYDELLRMERELRKEILNAVISKTIVG